MKTPSARALSIVSGACRPAVNRPAAATPRVLLAEADSRHRTAIESVLVRHGTEVVVARSLDEARASIAHPSAVFDAAVVAVSLPGGGGIRLLETLRSDFAPCLAVMRSDKGDLATMKAVLRAGVVELLFATEHLDEVALAVERTVEATRRLRAQLEKVASGTYTRENPVARAQRTPAHRLRPSAPTSRTMTIDVEHALHSLAQRVRLSPREQSVLRYIALGYRYRDIGAALEISPRTVKMHVTNMHRKVGVNSRYDLLREMFGQRRVSCS